jgi:hypothetical protein
MPSAIPRTTPAALTVVIAVLLLDHTPPATLFVKVLVAASQIVAAPVIAEGCAFTVIVFATAVPQPVVYDIVVVPAAIAEPVPALLMVATAVLLLLHVPKLAVLVSVAFVPEQSTLVPLIADGMALTVTVLIAEQAPFEYDIVVVPIVIPVNDPVVALIVAIPVLLLLHVPPSVMLS